ncbi:hypothetical protein [Nostoc sp.]|uniref:hypothetical protein n=1 Tax=Nostoc sp. TaxID=1180 RepID=UPI002FF7E8D4
MVDYRNFERFLHSRIKRRNLIIGAGALSGLAIANQFSHQTAIAKTRFSNVLKHVLVEKIPMEPLLVKHRRIGYIMA